MQFTDAEAAALYTMAGNATLTLTSRKTQQSYTFRVRAPHHQAENKPIRFVSLLTGPQNETDYTYLGLLRNGEFNLTAKSKMTADSAPVKAFDFFNRNVINSKMLPAMLEVRHEGRCGRCGRKLTVATSIDGGIGPECAKKI